MYKQNIKTFTNCNEYTNYMHHRFVTGNKEIWIYMNFEKGA